MRKLNLRFDLAGRYYEDGERMPFWYGFAYYDFDRDVRVGYIVPLNIIVALYRVLNTKLRFQISLHLHKWECEEFWNAYQLGYRHAQTPEPKMSFAGNRARSYTNILAREIVRLERIDQSKLRMQSGYTETLTEKK